jgi:S1-C subfamily serine protease
MSNPTPPDRIDPPKWQYWMIRVVPMLSIAILTISLPGILDKSPDRSDLGPERAKKLQQQIRSISIKVLAHGQTIGSGILFGRLDAVYTVATNARVIQSTSAPFQLQTADGQIYAAALVPPPLGQNRDVSMLRFQSLDRTYTTAKLATEKPKIGDRIWAAGFPLDPQPLSVPAKTAPWGLTIADGQITQILPIALCGGYNIGYDNPIRVGMSGGALVNRDGELIGMSAIETEALGNTANLLEDGSPVSAVVRSSVNNSSWAIPAQFIKYYADAQP